MVSVDDEDDGPIQLSSGALDALKEFYGERDARQKQFEDLKAQAEDDFEGKLSMDAFTEDWNASQFWASGEYASKPKLTLLEYDERFNVFKEFVQYDFEQPIKLPVELKGSFDRIICDPPFLSQDCQTKAALTVRWLAKTWTDDVSLFRLIVCTGERMETLIQRLYSKVGTQTTSFEVKHAKGLSNEFRCYANFECEDWKWAKKS
ncbi:Protein-lysine N-methyltransferase efm5 [Kalmusia sp. IMI 367209]|nr:Protein-lysine N-methyltransferase efm5 [Kalmusia sp. IMI 367209]